MVATPDARSAHISWRRNQGNKDKIIRQFVFCSPESQLLRQKQKESVSTSFQCLLDEQN